jgi:hypothetical protein
MTNSVIIENSTKEEILDALRGIVREELSGVLQAREPEVKFKTRKEVCALLKISLPTLAEYSRNGIIQGKRVGSRILYDEASVLAAVKQIPVVKHKRFLPNTVKPLA